MSILNLPSGILANSGGKAPYLLGRLFPSLKVDFDVVEKNKSNQL